jgi:hypothetical protein
MNEPEHTAIGRLLADAVPPLPEPADRIRQVRTRVRRARARARAVGVAAAASMVLIALALAVPRTVLHPADEPVPALDAGSCPTVTGGPENPALPSAADAAGPLVSEGAIEAMLCEHAVTDRPALVGSWVLSIGVDRLVEALNRSRTEEQPVAGWGVSSDPACANTGGSQFSLVLGYPGGKTATISLAGPCRTSYAAPGPVRYGDVLGEFGQLYRDQLVAAADQASIATPSCPAALDAARLDPTAGTYGPQASTIVRLSWAAPTERLALPVPLVAGAACRYAPDGDGARLAGSHDARDDLTALRGVLNKTFGDPDRRLRTASSGCGGVRATPPVVLLVADGAGGSAEFWVYRTGAGCARAAVVAGADQASRPVPEMVGYLDDVLGPQE